MRQHAAGEALIDDLRDDVALRPIRSHEALVDNRVSVLARSAIASYTQRTPVDLTNPLKDLMRAMPRRIPFAAGVALLVAACTPRNEPRRPDASAAQPPVPRALWVEETDTLLAPTAEWTNKVELADLDGDGLLDILFANGGDYSTPGTPELNRAFYNGGYGKPFVERTREVFGNTPDIARVVKARDFDGDGRVDVFVGTTYQAQSRLYLADSSGGFVERTGSHLPAVLLSVGDAEPGDVDGDGDLDLVLADWGPGNNMTNAGGRVRLWLNDGKGRFTDVTVARLPDELVRFSWDLELVDVDNDFDLDLLVSCKRCGGGLLYRNDGSGEFANDPRGLPQYTNNYEYEAMDLDGDGFLDLVTVNDGEIVGEVGSSRREHVFRNDGKGRYRDATDAWWPESENIGEDDNIVAFLDFDSDGDADFVIGSLSGADRLLLNDGKGHLRTANDVFVGDGTPGTLGLALGDLDGDGRMDVVQAQGEVKDAERERIFMGRGLAPDTSPPVIGPVTRAPSAGGTAVRVRVHDRKSPTLPTEWRSVEVRWTSPGGAGATPLVWYGEYLWRAVVPAKADGLKVCAVDAAGNETCLGVPAS
jgi:hypothetical protein